MSRYKYEPAPIGKTFGKWTVLEETSLRFYPKGGRQRRVLCICSCEKKTQRDVALCSLLSGNSTNCGCVRNATVANLKRTHNKKHHPIYNSWTNMIQRCENPNRPDWKLYGERGIAVCDRWFNSPIAFIEDMEPTWKPGLSLDRIDTNGQYCKENCRWVTQREQNRNKRTNHWVTVNGAKMILSDAAIKIGITFQYLSKMIKREGDEFVYRGFLIKDLKNDYTPAK